MRLTVLTFCSVVMFCAAGCEHSNGAASPDFRGEAASLVGEYRVDLADLRKSAEYRALRAIEGEHGVLAAERLIASAARSRLMIKPERMVIVDAQSTKTIAYRIVAQDGDVLVLELSGVGDSKDTVEVRRTGEDRFRLRAGPVETTYIRTESLPHSSSDTDHP